MRSLYEKLQEKVNLVTKVQNKLSVKINLLFFYLMGGLFLVQNFLLNLSCQYIKVFQGEKKLLGNCAANPLKLSFEKKYWYQGKERLYLLSFDRDESTNKIFVLIFDLPFSTYEIKGDSFSERKQQMQMKLKSEFFIKNPYLSDKFTLAEIYAQEGLFFGIKELEEFVLNLKLFNREVFLYSNHQILNFNKEQTLFDRIKHGISYYNQILFFSGVFFLIESKLVFIVYGEETYSTKSIIRKFIVASRISWAETITEQQSILLKRVPSHEWNLLKWFKTENSKDKITAQIGLHELTFVFDFHKNIEENPTIQIKGVDNFDTTAELKKLTILSMSVTKFVFSNLHVLNIITPQFRFEENLDNKQVLFLMYYDLSYEVNGSTETLKANNLVSYPLEKTKCVFWLGLKSTGYFSVTLKKKVHENRLIFEVEIQIDFVDVIDFQIPRFFNEIESNNHLKFQYIYKNLNYETGKAFHGALVIFDSEKLEKRQRVVAEAKILQQFSGKTKKFLFAFMVLFFLIFTIVSVFWVKNF